MALHAEFKRSDFYFFETFNSAQKGNAKDKVKIELYKQMRPDLFVYNGVAKKSNFMAGLANSGNSAVTNYMKSSGITGPLMQNGRF